MAVPSDPDIPASASPFTVNVVPSTPYGPVLAANVRLLRPIRVLVASRDLRFVSLLRFLLGRDQIGVEAVPEPGELLDAVQETSADVVVFDADGEHAARAVAQLQATHPDVTVMVVADGDAALAGALALAPSGTGPAAAATPSAAIRMACPSRRLIATATTSASAVTAGPPQPNPAFAVCHHSVR
jgi:DNA-binding NarL/FixJ family response regulator